MSPSEEWQSANRAEALFWLNDRLGQRVTLNLDVDVGNHSASLVSASGALLRAPLVVGESPDVSTYDPAAHQEGLAGLYEVGTSTLDLSDPELSCAFSVRGGEFEELRIRLGDDVEITVTRPTRHLPGGDA